MSDNKHADAVDIVARDVVRKCVGYAFDFGGVGWEDYPDLSETAWREVTERAVTWAATVAPPPTDFHTAYGFLSVEDGAA